MAEALTGFGLFDKMSDFDSTVLEEDFEFMADNQGVTCSFGALSFSAVAGDVGKTEKTEDAGFLAEFDLVISVLQSVFSTVPTFGDTIIVDGTAYQVMKINKDPLDPVIRFGLDTIHK